MTSKELAKYTPDVFKEISKEMAKGEIPGREE